MAAAALPKTTIGPSPRFFTSCPAWVAPASRNEPDIGLAHALSGRLAQLLEPVGRADEVGEEQGHEPLGAASERVPIRGGDAGRAWLPRAAAVTDCTPWKMVAAFWAR